MKKIINHIENTYKENKGYEIYSGYIKRFLECHPVNLAIITSIEDAIISILEKNHLNHNKSVAKELQNSLQRLSSDREKYSDKTFAEYTEIRIQTSEKDKYSIVNVHDFLLVNFGKLFSSVSTYIKSGDTLIDSTYRSTAKGFTISCKVHRDNQEYYFDTDCIYAGGYNIQCLHFRYIVKTKLPSISNGITDNSIIAKIKKDESFRLKLIELELPLKRYQNQLEAGNSWKALSDTEKYSKEGLNLLSVFKYSYECSVDYTIEYPHLEKNFRANEKNVKKNIKSIEKKIEKLKGGVA
jgi:hypothetical protein